MLLFFSFNKLLEVLEWEFEFEDSLNTGLLLLRGRELFEWEFEMELD